MERAVKVTEVVVKKNEEPLKYVDKKEDAKEINTIINNLNRIKNQIQDKQIASDIMKVVEKLKNTLTIIQPKKANRSRPPRSRQLNIK